MNFRSKVALAALTLTCVCAPLALASDVRTTDADERFRIKYGQYPPHVQRAIKNRPDFFARVDTNSDGRISKAEWKKVGRCSCQFSDHDADDDGFITRSEWTVATEEKAGS